MAISPSFYSGAITAGGPRTVFASSSRDGGPTWSSRVALSPSGVNAAFPVASGTGNDDVQVWFMDQRTGRWNTWYTTSTNLGAAWSTPVRISDATSGTAYKVPEIRRRDLLGGLIHEYHAVAA